MCGHGYVRGHDRVHGRGDHECVHRGCVCSDRHWWFHACDHLKHLYAGACVHADESGYAHDHVHLGRVSDDAHVKNWR